MRLFISLFFVVVIFELLIIIGDIGKGSKIIRKTLKPLAELSETAKTFNAEVSSMGSKIDYTHIKDLAGAISSIDANRLDRYICG